MYDDGRQIGRLREEHAPPRPERAWYWSITVLGPGRGRVRTEGNAATLEEAKVQFAAAWTAFKVVQQDAEYLCRTVDEVERKIASLRN